MEANLNNSTQTVTFDLPIDDRFVRHNFTSPNKYILQVSYYTKEAGKATNVSYRVFNSQAHAFIWTPELFNYIQAEAEKHFTKYWAVEDKQFCEQFENDQYSITR